MTREGGRSRTGRRRRAVSILVSLVAIAVFWARGSGLGAPPKETRPATSEAATGATSDALADAFANRRSDVQVEGLGVVDRVLADDNDGSRHQRFILRLASGRTLLVAHNIDLAPRLERLARGDTVRFNGEYEWNADGGVLHWTHKDPAGRHIAGWLEHDGRRVE